MSNGRHTDSRWWLRRPDWLRVPGRHGRIYTALGLLAAMIIATVAYSSTQFQDLHSQRDAKAAQATHNAAVATANASVANQGKALAEQVNVKCRTSATFRRQNTSLCPQASALVTAKPSPIPTGAAGRGIALVQNINGHLVLFLTDSTRIDAGQFVGPTGKTGKNGLGIKAQTLISGHLVVSYTDGRVVDLGEVVGPAGTDGKDGPAGISVTDVSETVDFHLIVTYSDGRTQDVGTLPPGPQGPKGDKGDTGATGPDECVKRGGTWTEVPNPPLSDGGSTLECTIPPSPAAS
jgi:hypothetical protein